MIPTRAGGLCLRIRHLLIPVVYFALILAISLPVLKHFNTTGLFNAPIAILLVSPWLLGILVLLLERKSPIKYWAAPVLLSLTSPALAICHDWFLVVSWRESGTIPNVIVSFCVNTLLIGTFTYFIASMYPDNCPRCGHRALIPLLRLWGRSKRTSNTRWCGACGAQYWRTGRGLWQKERRATWVDSLRGDGRPEPAGGAPRPLGLRTEQTAGQPRSAENV